MEKMELQEEVHSDDGSFEFIDPGDYFNAIEHMNTEGVVSSNSDMSDGSYDFISSDLSEMLAITKGEASNTNTQISAQIKSLSLEEDDDEEEEEEENTGMDFFDTRKKRNFMTMAYENSNFDVYDYPSHIKLKEDMTIKEMAKNHILRFLPAKSLTRCKLVSKEWEQWISSPFFRYTQSESFKKTSGFFQNDNSSLRFISLNHLAYGFPYNSLYLTAPEKVSIKSSSNGLLLCQSCDCGNKYYISNPAKQQWRNIPPSSYYHGFDPKIVLAFQPSSLNFESFYQIICPFSLPDLTKGPIVYFDIYDSQTKSWRVSDMICVDLHESDVKSDGVFVNGVVYWETTGGELLAFDLKNEIYGVQALPFGEGGGLSKVNGELTYVKPCYDHESNVCILEVYGGGVMSLKSTMSFEVLFDEVKDGGVVECRVVGNSCDDVLGVMVKMKCEGRNRLFAYNVEDGTVDGPWFLWSDRNMFAYVNSLVPLDAC